MDFSPTGRRLAGAPVVTIPMACAHLPVRGDLALEERLLASAAAFASTVPQPAARYAVVLAPGSRVDPILRAAAAEGRLRLAADGVLTRPNVDGSRSVRLTVGELEWVGEGEARIPFTHATDGGAAVACALHIKVKSPVPQSWLYRPEGEESCWPRPSPKASPGA